MLIVRGTKKLRDRVKQRAEESDASTTVLGDWFATALFWKPQVALLVNERTFVPVFMPLAPAATLLDRAPAAIATILRRHGVDENFIADELEAMRDVRLAPTNNRSVLGVMNGFESHGAMVVHHRQDRSRGPVDGTGPYADRPTPRTHRISATASWPPSSATIAATSSRSRRPPEPPHQPAETPTQVPARVIVAAVHRCTSSRSR